MNESHAELFMKDRHPKTFMKERHPKTFMKERHPKTFMKERHAETFMAQTAISQHGLQMSLVFRCYNFYRQSTLRINLTHIIHVVIQKHISA